MTLFSYRSGLLDIGRRELLAGFLRQELPRYGDACTDLPQYDSPLPEQLSAAGEAAGGQAGAAQAAAAAGGAAGAAAAATAMDGQLPAARWMPTRRRLAEAGRGDLVALIERVGGFAQVRGSPMSTPLEQLKPCRWVGPGDLVALIERTGGFAQALSKGLCRQVAGLNKSNNT